MSFRIQNGQIVPSGKTGSKNSNAPSADFEAVLSEKIASVPKKLKISSHAMDRMNKRGISLEDKDMEKIGDAISKLDKKGARESLVLYNESAFIASVRNRTIITAMKGSEIDVVTNIDSAIMVK